MNFSLSLLLESCVRERRRKENPNRIIYHGWGNIFFHSKTCWNNFCGNMLKKLFEIRWRLMQISARINWFLVYLHKIFKTYLLRSLRERSERAQLELTVENWFMIYDLHQDVVQLEYWICFWCNCNLSLTWSHADSLIFLLDG